MKIYLVNKTLDSVRQWWQFDCIFQKPTPWITQRLTKSIVNKRQREPFAKRNNSKRIRHVTGLGNLSKGSEQKKKTRKCINAAANWKREKKIVWSTFYTAMLLHIITYKKNFVPEWIVGLTASRDFLSCYWLLPLVSEEGYSQLRSSRVTGASFESCYDSQRLCSCNAPFGLAPCREFDKTLDDSSLRILHKELDLWHCCNTQTMG